MCLYRPGYVVLDTSAIYFVLGNRYATWTLSWPYGAGSATRCKISVAILHCTFWQTRHAERSLYLHHHYQNSMALVPKLSRERSRSLAVAHLLRTAAATIRMRRRRRAVLWPSGALRDWAGYPTYCDNVIGAVSTAACPSCLNYEILQRFY